MYIVDTLKYVEPNVISSYIVNFGKAAIVDPGTAKGADIILEELNPDWDVDYYVEKLRKEDEDVDKLFQILSGKPVAMSFIYTSVTGMLDAAKRWENAEA